MTIDEPVSTAWQQLIAAAEAAVCRGDEAQLDELTRLERHQWLMATQAYAIEMFVAGDPARPQLSLEAGPERRRNGDNPDALYYGCVIDPNLTYRVRADVGDSLYTAVTVYGGNEIGEKATEITGHLNNVDVGAGPGEPYEVILSKQRHDGPWIQLTDDSWHLVTRDYFTDRRADRRTRWTIEAVDAPTERRIDTADQLAARIGNVTRYLDAQTMPAPIVEPNTVAPPFLVKDSTAPGVAAADAAYARGTFQLDPGQALVLRGRSPKCLFWNVVLWNRYLQTLDFRYERTSLNHTEVALNSDGSWTIVVADTDPGHPNWISTVGHREGIIFCRWFLAEEAPDPIEAELVDLADVPKLL